MSRFNFTASGFSTVDATNTENMPPFPNKPSAAKLYVGENIEFTNKGAIRTRKGFESLGTTGSGAAIDNIFTHLPYSVLFVKSGTAIYQSFDGITWYSIGATRTATERDIFHSIDKDVHVSNQTDNYIRIAVSTLAEDITVATTSFDIRAGDGGKFTDGSATLYIEGDEINYTGTTGDQIDGVTNIATNHSTGAIVTQVTTVSTSLKGQTLSDTAGKTLVSAIKGDPYVIWYSDTKTYTNPELAYAYTGGSSGNIYMQSPVVQLADAGEKTIIIQDGRIDYTSDITGTIPYYPVSKSHGGLNNRCAVQGDRFLYILTNTGRILPVIYDDQGVYIADKTLPDYKKLDYPIRSFLADMSTSQTGAYGFFDPSTSTVTFVVNIDGIYIELKYQEDVGAWSVDKGKNIGCRTYVNGVIYGGSDNMDEIYKDNYGLTDNTIPIYSRILTGILSADERRITFDADNLVLGGLLSDAGKFTMRLHFYSGGNQASLEKVVTAADLKALGLMSISGSGIPIGSGQIGAQRIGYGGDASEAYRFTFPFEFLNECDGIQLEIEVTDEGSVLELSNFRIEAETDAKLLLPTT